MTGRSGMEAGRNSASESHSNYSRAINDGQWHSFGGASSARSGVAVNSPRSGNSHLTARNGAIADGAWHSFGGSRGANFAGGGFRSGFGRGNYGFGFGRGWGYGRGWGGWGWGWGLGWGWPYWGWGWNPWWFDPYWYAPWPMYNPDYYYDNNYIYGDDDVRPPYRRHDDRPGPPPANQANPPASTPNTQPANPTTGVSPTDTGVTVSTT